MSSRATRAVWAGVFALTMGTALAAPAAPTAAAPAGGAVVTWNLAATEAALAACLAPTDNPLHESRMYAMTQVAVHDALNAIDRRFEPYVFDGAAASGASVPAAVAAAAHDVLVPSLLAIPAPFPPACGEAGAASIEAAYTAVLAGIADGPAKDEGIAVGQAAAAAVMAQRADDGSGTPLIVTDYPQGTAPGEYRHTPGTPFVFAPGWAHVTPFVLDDTGQYHAHPPYKVTARAYAADYAEVKRLGGDGVGTPSERTAEQTEIALFWLESSPSGWNRIARTVAGDASLDEWENARLFGLLNLALADGYISSFATKYHHDFWRPVTAIQHGDVDGNPATVGDPDWTPLVTTPPIPDHDSAHAVEGAAAAEVFRRFFGTDEIAFVTCSRTLPAGQTCTDASPELRSFSSFTEAAEENGESRILVGFHFRHAVDDGLARGRMIGQRAYLHYLRPAT